MNIYIYERNGEIGGRVSRVTVKINIYDLLKQNLLFSSYNTYYNRLDKNCTRKIYIPNHIDIQLLAIIMTLLTAFLRHFCTPDDTDFVIVDLVKCISDVLLHVIHLTWLSIKYLSLINYQK